VKWLHLGDEELEIPVVLLQPSTYEEWLRIRQESSREV